MVKLPPIVRRLQEWLERVHTWKWVLDSIGFGGLTMSVVGLVQALRSRLDWVALGALFVASSLMLYIAMRHAASAAPEAVPPAPPDPTKEERQSGVVSAEELRATPVRLSGEVFAIELLKSGAPVNRD